MIKVETNSYKVLMVDYEAPYDIQYVSLFF